jgi:predicted PurR-regulated permease PerM
MSPIFLAIFIVFFVITIASVIMLFLYIKNNIQKTPVDEKQNEKLLDLERRITDLMISQLNNVNTSVSNTQKDINSQIQSFTRETIKVQEFLKQTNTKMEGLSSFQDLFKTPKLRGE